MSVATIPSDHVVQHLNGLSFGKVNNINDKLALLLEAEYRRRLARYSLTDQQLGQKYQMGFDFGETFPQIGRGASQVGQRSECVNDFETTRAGV